MIETSWSQMKTLTMTQTTWTIPRIANRCKKPRNEQNCIPNSWETKGAMCNCQAWPNGFSSTLSAVWRRERPRDTISAERDELGNGPHRLTAIPDQMMRLEYLGQSRVPGFRMNWRNGADVTFRKPREFRGHSMTTALGLCQKLDSLPSPP